MKIEKSEFTAVTDMQNVSERGKRKIVLSERWDRGGLQNLFFNLILLLKKKNQYHNQTTSFRFDPSGVQNQTHLE